MMLQLDLVFFPLDDGFLKGSHVVTIFPILIPLCIFDGYPLMHETLNIMNEISLIIWDDGIETILIRQTSEGLPKVCTIIWPLFAFFQKFISTNF